MRQDGDEITLTRDELVRLVRTIQLIHRWTDKPLRADTFFAPNPKTKAKAKGKTKTRSERVMPKATSVLEFIKAFEERFKTEVPALEKLAFELLAQIEEQAKREGKVTGDGSAWIVSTRLEQKTNSSRHH